MFLIWVLLFGFYLLFVGQATIPELVAALVTSGLAAAYHRHVRRNAHRHFRLAVPWMVLTLRVGRALARDTVLVGWALARAIFGCSFHHDLTRQPFDGGGDTPRAAAHRGIAVLAVSIAPNSYAIDVLEPAFGLLMHRLVPCPPAEDREWPV
jgi:hypothetical protein